MTPRWPGSSTLPAIESCLLRRPDRAGHEPRLSGVRRLNSSTARAGQLARGQVDLAAPSASKPKSAIATLVAPNVFVSMMSAPASRYWRWMLSIASGCVIAEDIDEVLQVLADAWRTGRRGSPFSPKPQRMDHRPHRAVEHQDSLGEELLKHFSNVRDRGYRHVLSLFALAA